MADIQVPRLTEFGLALAGAALVGFGGYMIYLQTLAELELQGKILGIMKDQYRWQPPGISATGFATVIVGVLAMGFAAALASCERMVALRCTAAKTKKGDTPPDASKKPDDTAVLAGNPVTPMPPVPAPSADPKPATP